MINLRVIDHVVFRVKDMDAMIRFYENVLGARVEKRQPDFGLIQLRAGESLIDLVDVDGAIGRQGGEAILSHLAEHGINGAEIVSRYGAEGDGPSIYLKDPKGNIIELKGPPWPPERTKTG